MGRNLEQSYTQTNISKQTPAVANLISFIIDSLSLLSLPSP